MEWQLILVGLAVAAAAAYLGRESWRTWRTSPSGCAGGCGCGAGTPASRPASVALIPTEQLTSRLQAQQRAG